MKITIPNLSEGVNSGTVVSISDDLVISVPLDVRATKDKPNFPDDDDSRLRVGVLPPIGISGPMTPSI